jgi:hypothetical protein
MRAQKPGVGTVLLIVVAALAGLVILSKVFKLALVAVAAFVVWRLVAGKSSGAGRLPTRTVDALDPLDTDVLTIEDFAERERDSERERLDRELERAIAASKTRPVAG